MRILLIAPQPFYEDRGTPIAVRDTLSVMSQLGFQVDLATFPIGTEITFPGVQVLRTANPLRFKSVPVGLSFRKIVLDIGLFAKVLRLFYRNRYDCIHAVEEGAAMALICKALSGIPVIYDMQSSMPEQLRKFKVFKEGPGRWLSLQFERWLVSNADYIVSSIGLAPRIQSIQPEKKVLESFFEGCDFRPRDENLAKSLGSFGRPTVVYTGTFASYQGLEHLMAAAALVREEIPEVIFILVGGTEAEIARLSSWLTKYKLENNVKLHRRLPRQEIPDYIALADILVLPRISGENAPLKIYDYMKSGKPIVATGIPAHRAMLTDETAVLVEPNIEGLSKGILLALQNTDYAKKVATAAQNSLQAEENKPLKETISEAYSLVLGKSSD